jgi:G patch domain-containing protein 1
VVQPWKQEVRDENGRRRLHGAFTGGFSAGYFNTVGSKEGWAPKQFVSSRSKRASETAKASTAAAAAGGDDDDDGDVNGSKADGEQKATDFMDQEDLEQFGLVEGLVAREDFDMLGGTAAELARRKRDQARGASGSKSALPTSTSATTGASASAIPAFAPEQLIGTVSGGVGARLLRTMGWREGQGAGARRQRRSASTATNDADNPDAVLESFQFAPDNVKIIEYDLKQDRRGIGFDPYKNADVVRKARANQRVISGPVDDEHTQVCAFARRYT